MKKFLIASTLLCMALTVSAQTFQVEGITYTVEDSGSKTAAVGNNTTATATDVVIPSTVTYEGITYTVTTVKDNAFANNTSLRSITLPASVTKIESQAFLRCNALTSATFPGVQQIDKFAFYECKALQSVSIPDCCTTLGNRVWYASGLRNVVVGSGLKNIASGVFESCDSLTTATLKPGLKKLGSDMFYYCTALNSVSIPVGIDTIPSWCFAWTGLTQFTIPNTVRHIDNFAFCNIIASEVTIPEGVVSIGANSFSQNTQLQTVNLPSTLRHIGDYAFALSPFTTVTLPDSLETLGDCAFISCPQLTTLNIPGTVKKIPYELCHNDSKLVNLSLNEGTTSIGTAAFHGLRNLTSFTIPASVTEIEGNPISYTAVRGDKLVCKSPEFIVDNGILYSKDRTRLISYNSTETTFSVPSSVKEISAFAFADAVGQTFTAVTLPEGITTLGDAAFGWCNKLTSVNLPSTITSMGEQVFDYCSKLQAIEIPEGITEIKRETFYYCKALKDIKLPSTLQKIGQGAFASCSVLDSIALPASVTSISQRAFASCNKLMAITCHATTPATLGAKATAIFSSNTLKKGRLHVPHDALGAYQGADGWNSFANILNDVSAVNDIFADEENAWQLNNGILQIAPGQPYAIYTVDGRCVASGVATFGRTFELPGGTYIIRAGKQSAKIMIP